MRHGKGRTGRDVNVCEWYSTHEAQGIEQQHKDEGEKEGYTALCGCV